MDKHEMDAIVEDYLNGIDVIGLAQKYHRGIRTVMKVLHEAGVAGELRRRAADARRGRPAPVYLHSTGLVGTLEPRWWAYVAGLFDGEGSIIVRGPRDNMHRRYALSIAQKDATPLRFIQQSLGVGKIYLPKTHPVHSFRLDPQRAVFEFLCAILPYLIVKRDMAHSAIAGLCASYGWEVPL